MYQPSPKLAPLQALIAAGKADQARAQLARLLQRSPGDPEASATMAAALGALGHKDQAAFYARKAVESARDDPARHVAAGDMLAALGLHDEALAAYARAAQLRPADLSVQLGLLNYLYGSGRLVDAESAARGAIRNCPGAPEPRLMLAFVLMGLARAPDADAALSEALAAFPDTLALATARAASANYLPDADPAAVFDLHRAYGRMLDRLMSATPVPFGAPFEPDRRLRVAIISPDFRTHSVSFFIEALLAHADISHVELIGVSTVDYEDATTARLRSLAARTGSWRTWPGFPDRDLAERLRREKIDIAVEIAGHGYRHSLGALHLRAAPVQVSYMGYPNTTGVPAIDFRIVDSLTDPPGAEAFAVEKLIRLDPCFLCYTPAPGAPAPAARPPDGPIVFGSFNNLSKLNDGAIRRWARVVASVNGSRLLVKNLSLGDAKVRHAVAARFAAAGFPADRLDLIPPAAELGAHLSMYARVDIALDTFPYCGTTTTCEALSMGVPVVSMAGPTHASRVGLSLLRAAGLADLCAGDEAGYIRIASALAKDQARLASLRATLRPTLLASPLCDGPAFARRFVGALRSAWRDRCRAPSA